MPEFGELATVVAHVKPNRRCPFCPGEKEERTTYAGAANDSGILRDVMNDPPTLTSKQSNARPKDGVDGRQPPDEAKPSPNPIFTHKDHGAYSDQAHHAISGNEIMKGDPIEKLIVKGEEVEAHTGYSINNCANGVYLPSYPRQYDGKWGDMKFEEKLEIMLLPMRGSEGRPGKGQAHIGSHKGHVSVYDEMHYTYPDQVKKMLEKLRTMALPWAEKCGFCLEGGNKKKPLPAPYRINAYLDAISSEVIEHLTAPPSAWRYFISKYAVACHDAAVAPAGKAPSAAMQALKPKPKK